MSTTAQMKLVAAPLLEKHDDLVLRGRFLFLKPVRHVIRFILLDGTSGTTDFRPRAGAYIAFEKSDRININFSTYMRHPARGSVWPVFETNHEYSFAEAVSSTVLPQLRSIESIYDFVKFTENVDNIYNNLNGHQIYKIPLGASLGNFDEPCAHCELISSGKAHECMPGFESMTTPIMEELWPAMKARDIGKVAAVLHDWEEYTVKANKLEKYWEPTPFPIEQM
jgi:hypothetical protein